MSLCGVLQIAKITSANTSLVSPGTISDPLSTRLLLEVDLVKGEDLVGFLGRDFHPAYFSGDSSIRPGDEPFEASLTLVGPLNVVLPTKMTSLTCYISTLVLKM
jgi:hypothetical protein